MEAGGIPGQIILRSDQKTSIDSGQQLYMRSRGGNVNIENPTGNASFNLTSLGSVASITGTNVDIESTGLSGDVDIDGQRDVNIIAGNDIDLTATDDINLTATEDIFLDANINMTIKSDDKFDMETSASDIVLRPGGGKTVLTKADSNTRAPVRVSGVDDTIDNFTTDLANGDIGFTEPSTEAARGGEGRLWLSTGSGIAPISIGSGITMNRAASNTTVTGTGGTFTALNINTTDVLDLQYQKPNTTTVTIINDGWYRVSFNAGFANSSATFNSTRAGILKNGTIQNGANMDTSINGIALGGAGNCGATTILNLAAGDTIQLGASKIVGTAATIVAQSSQTWLALEKIRPPTV